MNKALFKVAITVLDSKKKPYLLQVAIWNGKQYICHEYRFERHYDTISLFHSYINANEKGEAMVFHEKYLNEVDRVMRLPINEGRDEPLKPIAPPIL